MGNDPLYGDRPKPPMVPMGLGEVVGFDLARTATAGTERRRPWHTTALVLLVVALIGLVVALVTADNHRGIAGVHSPRQAVTYLCSHYEVAERAFTNGQIPAADFAQKLEDLPVTGGKDAALVPLCWGQAPDAMVAFSADPAVSRGLASRPAPGGV